MRNNIPKGTLMIIGGGEDKGSEETHPDIERANKDFEPFEILKNLLPSKKSKQFTIEIITAATEIPEDYVKDYMKAFKKIDGATVKSMSIVNNAQAKKPAFLERIKKAHCVFFTGGDQFRLTSIIGGTSLHELILDRYLNEKDFVVAGTSAGAMAMATLMISEGQVQEAMLKGGVKISSGLGFIDHCIIDTHFVKRGRCSRLTHAILMNPSCIGIGLGEDTALLIRKGNEALCIGSGMVVIIDGKDIGHTNIAFVEENEPICVENLRMHMLVRQNKILLKEREFKPAAKYVRMENKTKSKK
jgi:cyanophycinase